MEISVYPSYDELSFAAANGLISFMQNLAKPLCCIASGDSPLGLYKELAKRYQYSQIDISNWKFAGLDEWLGMDGSDEGSCRHMLEHTVVKPLKLKPEQACFFDGRTNDTVAECSRVEKFIELNGGLDVAVLGLGINGHLGLNEPGTSFKTRAHVSEISESTQIVGQKYFSNPTALAKGITLGLGNLMEARKIILLVSGARKAEIIKQVVEGAIDSQIPASILQKHPSCIVYLDKAAASLLKNKP